MRLTNVLRAQHLGWHFKKHWQIQGKRTPIDTGAKAILEGQNIKVVDALEIANEKTNNIEKLIFDRELESTTNLDNIKTPLCYVYQDKHVLLEGLTQARVLTNTIEITSMPKRIQELLDKNLISSVVDRNVQDLILSSNVFDAEQEKLAKVKIPEKPAFNLPRIYGITDEKKFSSTISKLLFECEKLVGKTLSGKRRIIDKVNFITSFTREECKVQLNLPIELLVTSDRAIEPFKEKYNAELPDLFPLKCTISIPHENEIPTNDFYPLRKDMKCSHPHTIIIFYSPTKVKSLSEIPVSNEQYQARTLLAAFATSAARAQQLYGDVKKLPKPIVVQSIQTDGKTFHFGIYQLNTLDLDNTDGIKNYWFHLPNMNLFEQCSYVDGRPVLEGYNKEVVKYMKALYQNV